MTPLAQKSTLEEIRANFDADVERFSNLETGQQAAMDAVLILELIAKAAKTHLKRGDRVLDIGCGAGNVTLRVMQEAGPMESLLVDLSQPMLERAKSRVQAAGAVRVTTAQTDLRSLQFEEGSMDCIVAVAVLHHLRDEQDWRNVFALLHRWLKPGGRLYVADLVCFDDPAMQALMWARYGDHLTALGGESYRDAVFAHIDKEDSPRSLPFQFDLLRNAGFTSSDVLHRNSVFACYYAVK